MKYVTEGEVSAELLDKAGNKLMPERSKKLFVASGIILLAGAAIEAICGYVMDFRILYIIAVVFGVVGLAMIIAIPQIQARFVKLSRDRFLEEVPAGRFTVRVTFEDNEIKVIRKGTGGETRSVKYDEIQEMACVVEDHFDGAPVFAAYTQSGMFYVFLGSLSDADQKKLLEHLKIKNVKIAGFHA